MSGPMVDTTGYELAPFPTSWGTSAASMDAVVSMMAELVRGGASMAEATEAAMALLRP